MLKNIMEGVDVERETLAILQEIHISGPINPISFEKLAFIKKFHNEVFVKFEKKLLCLIGLFYKTGKPESIIEEVYSLYANSIKDETGKRFTPVQADAYRKIHSKKYFSFSAPTSTGKSYLFRELIKRDEGDIVIVVPSRALIAEYVSAVLPLVGKSVLVLPFIDNINTSKVKRRIFIVTPERGVDLFKYRNQFKVDLFLLDEAQLSEENVRGMKFDSFVRRADQLFPDAKKVFAHPFVNNPDAQIKKHGIDMASAAFMKYAQQTVGKICLCVERNCLSYFSPYSTEKEFIREGEDIVGNILGQGGTILIYTAKSKIYNKKYKDDFAKFIEMCPRLSDPAAMQFVEKLKKFIGAADDRDRGRYSHMVEMMEKGIVIHHGSMPLKARFIIEDFVRANYARICFATSTLNQGINMPFDVVWIDNFTRMDVLTLKNLMGRAGRTTTLKNKFEYGYVVIKKGNIPTFSQRLRQEFTLKDTSLLDEDVRNVPDDLKDISEAIKNNTFDDDLHLTKTQVERLRAVDVFESVEFILGNLFGGDLPLTGEKYYKLSAETRNTIKAKFKNIYVSHLRRQELSSAEMGVLSAAIPIMLWRIQGKSFREIVSLRYAFLSERDQQREIRGRFKRNEITLGESEKMIQEITIRYTPPAAPLPNINLRRFPLFPRGTSVTRLDYDTLVYDTYDYLDKVISLSLVDPITAALQIYYEKTQDERAVAMKNYVRYGTNDSWEIWLSRYGFGFEDIDWLKQHIKSIDEKGIVFKSSINEVAAEKMDLVSRYT